MVFIKSIDIEQLVGSKGMHSEISLDSLLHHLEEDFPEESADNLIPRLVIQQIKETERTKGKLSLENIKDYQDTFALISGLVNNLSNAKTVAWGIATPVPSTVIAGTEKLYDILQLPLHPLAGNDLMAFYKELTWPNKLLQELVLQRFYDIPRNIPPYICEYQDENGIKRYLELNVDFSFVSVELRDELPKVDFSCVREQEITDAKDMQPLIDSLNLDKFIFKGFSMISVTDCTTSYVMDKIQYMIANLSSYSRADLFGQINDSIRSIVRSPVLNCVLIPMLYLNGMPILKEEISRGTVLFDGLIGNEVNVCREGLFNYLESPSIISYGIDPDFDTTVDFIIEKIQQANITCYMCFPLKYNDELVGFFELSTVHEKVLKRSILADLSLFFPVFTQLAYDLRLEFKNRLDNVILQNFTALQPAVQWRFNQAAAIYLRDKEYGSTPPEMEQISFDKVYPLYGAIDVKDSTNLRNLAFRKDSKKHLDELRKVLADVSVDQLYDKHALRSFKRRIDTIDSWLLTDHTGERMQDITLFFKEEVSTFLRALHGMEAGLDTRIANYKKLVKADTYQDAFEVSLQKLNDLVNKKVLELNDFVQEKFPSYFEKFRTDGVEYDIYAGQSISPNKIFHKDILRTFRKQQVISMAHISKAVHELADELPVTLSTTQLLFIHPMSIDVSFRRDEKRFDVEGGYNIRYHVIKKRIDKVMILGTKERLVQPGKIAIVMHGNGELYALLDDLTDIAEMGLISREVEHLELEELQGVSGLKAIRVAVTL